MPRLNGQPRLAVILVMRGRKHTACAHYESNLKGMLELRNADP